MSTRPNSPKTPPKAPAIVALIALVGVMGAADLMTDTRKDEGVVRHAYRDLGGVWTICSGTTRGVKPGQEATPEGCDALTAADLVIAVRDVERCSPVLKQPSRFTQLRASVRFSNNTGAFCKGWWRKRPSVSALINVGKWCSAGREMLRYDLVKGKRIPGLTNRRRSESAMFLSTLQCLAGVS